MITGKTASIYKYKFEMKKMVYTAILTAIVLFLQLVVSPIKFGQFSITFCSVPIVIGAIICGPLTGLWLGMVFGIAVLLSGDAALFLPIDPFGTAFIVLLKGAIAGFVSGLIFDLLKKKDMTIATYLAAVCFNIVNTGIFYIGCRLFFFDWVKSIAGGTNGYLYILTGVIGLNFFIEVAVSVLFAPVIARLIALIPDKKQTNKSIRDF